jgi:arsenite-transporting ATPase
MPTPDAVASPLPTDAAASALCRDLLSREVLLVTGKGGVGKSSVAQALARRASRQGRRVLLLELESVSRAGPLFGAVQPGPAPQQVAPQLDLAVLDAMDSLRFFAVQQLRIETLVNLALRNKAVEGFFQAVPAVKPILFLYHVWQLLEQHGPRGDRRWDLVICDLPTSGFVQGMYQIPHTLQQTFRAGPVHQYAEGMGALLRDNRRCGLVLVTLPEEMPVVETLELQRALAKAHGVRPAAVVLNGVFPPGLEAHDLAHLAAAVQAGVPDAERVEEALAEERAVGVADSGDLQALAAWLWTAELLAARRLRAESLLPRLSDACDGRILTLPFVFRRTLPLGDIDTLADALGGGQRGAP